jgi:hypothetical protein
MSEACTLCAVRTAEDANDSNGDIGRVACFMMVCNR